MLTCFDPVGATVSRMPIEHLIDKERQLVIITRGIE